MRFLVYRILTYVGLAILAGGLFYVQVVEGSYYRVLGDNNRLRLIPMEAPRGRVFDRNGNLLATNRAAYDVVATPEDITKEGSKELSQILGITEAEIKKRLRAPREYPFTPALIEEDVPQVKAFEIEERRPELPGVDIQVSGLRYYPYENTASHLIGFIGKINGEEYKKYREQKNRYGYNSMIGRIGLERMYDDYLRGWRGGRQIEVNAQGKLIRVLSEKYPEPGKDITVTLDLEFQKRVMELIGDQKAVVGVMDLESEEMLVMASNPSFDPNVFVMPGHSKERLEFLRDKEAPLLDRGVGSAYPPGSIFKLVTAIAGLETGKITPNTTFYCPGYFKLTPNTRPMKCWFAPGHGDINMYEALERSCNVYFYNVGKLLSADQIAEYARKLGFGQEMEMEVSNISPGLVPDSTWKKEKLKEKWYKGETLSYAIGQSYLLTTPIQILRLSAILAKDGDYVEPKIIRTKELAHERDDHRRSGISPKNIAAVKKGMFQVVESNFGTGQLARVDFGHMAGKTGTAQAPPKNSHAWMTGFFPYENPKIAFVAFAEHGGSGGLVAGRLVKGTLEIWKELYATPTP